MSGAADPEDHVSAAAVDYCCPVLSIVVASVKYACLVLLIAKILFLLFIMVEYRCLVLLNNKDSVSAINVQ